MGVKLGGCWAGEDVESHKVSQSSRSAVILEGEKLDVFNVEQGVAQGCSSSPILFSVFIMVCW